MIDPKLRVNAGRGAPMGRRDKRPRAYGGHLVVQQVPLDDGGYDPGGAYWGTGDPLWWFGSDDGEVFAFTRAPDVEAARAVARTLYPEATVT
jgi:hypothetical protein